MRSVIVFFFIIPVLITALSREDYASLESQAASHWLQHEQLCLQAQVSSGHEAKKAILTQALAVCQRGLWLVDNMLAELAVESKTARKKSWWINLKKEVETQKARFSSQTSYIKEQLSSLDNQLAMQGLLDFAKQKIVEAEAQARQHAKNLYNVDELVIAQNRAASLFKEAAALYDRVISASFAEEKEVALAHKQYCLQAFALCQKEAEEWPLAAAEQLASYRAGIEEGAKEYARLSSLGLVEEGETVRRHCQHLFALLVENAPYDEEVKLTSWFNNIDFSALKEKESVEIEDSKSLEEDVFEELDLFAKENNYDPLVLANFVQNEIATTDFFLYEKEGVFYSPGIFKSPLQTFRQRKGTPWEQCQLLVYLLRKAGLDASYAVEGRCSVPKDIFEDTVGTPIAKQDSYITVSYPWVVCSDGLGKTSLFPWLKEKIQGCDKDLLSHALQQYRSTQDWLTAYERGDRQIHKYKQEGLSNTAAELFLRFLDDHGLQKELKTKGLYQEGICCKQWHELPKAEVIQDPQLLLDPQKAGAYATLQITIAPQNNNQIKMQHQDLLYKIAQKTSSVIFEGEGNNVTLRAIMEEKVIGSLFLDGFDGPLEVTTSVNYTLGDTKHSAAKNFILKNKEPTLLVYSFGEQSATKEDYRLDAEKQQSQAVVEQACVEFFARYNNTIDTLSKLHRVNAAPFFAIAVARASKESIKDTSFDVALFYPACSAAVSQSSFKTITTLRDMVFLDTAARMPLDKEMRYRDLIIPSALICTVFVSKYVTASLSPASPSPAAPFYPMPKPPFRGR